MNDAEYAIAACVRNMLEILGEDVNREGLKDTPQRVAKMYVQELFRGLYEDPVEIFDRGVFDETHGELVLVRDIPFYSLCEHHLVPFYGKAHVGYIPYKKALGLSKIARVVRAVAARPSIQERITTQTADLIDQQLEPRGVMVIISAEHLCMSMRGVQAPGTFTTTSAVRGVFRDVPAAREELLALLRG